MKAARTINKNQNGKAIAITVSLERGTRDIIAYADGWNIKTGTETFEDMEITVTVDGKVISVNHSAPSLLSTYNKNYKDLSKAGVVATLNNVNLSKERYEEIMNMIAECKSELVAVKDEEYTATKEIEVAKEAAETEVYVARQIEYANQIKNGLCPHCRTWCYGDCKSH